MQFKSDFKFGDFLGKRNGRAHFLIQTLNCNHLVKISFESLAVGMFDWISW